MPIYNEITLAKELIKFPSVTPIDAGVMKFLAKKLTAIGFDCKILEFKDKKYKPVKNLYARLGKSQPNFMFAGHLDVVPPGNLNDWTIQPFRPAIKKNHLIGRGANDMKSAIASWVVAVNNFMSNNKKIKGSISLLITGDEEGFAINGTKKVVDYLKKKKEKIDFCLVGEPTNPNKLGEMIKIGRRGSITGELTIIGAQGHVAYPDRANNPSNTIVKILKEIKEIKFDRGTKDFQPTNLEVTKINIDNTADNVIPGLAKATFNIRFNNKHSLQKFKDISYTDKLKNKLEYKYIPIESVAIYIPGSTASYPSSVLMNAIPAIVAGVKRIVMINPAYKGKQNPAVLYAARKCKIKEIYSIGGASAIAALAYGTKKIKKVDKIVGPGNSYVTAAKKEVFGEVGIEGMIAGPSEVTIVCDKHSNPEWVASDFIGQAEHDSLAQCILISKDKSLLKKVNQEIIKQLKNLPRAIIAKKSILQNGILIHISSDQKIINVVNKIAPEHLELNVKNYKKIVAKIKNSGSICLGKYAVMAMTDYNVGSNHVLPTNSSARYSSGVSVNEFYKRISYINLSKKGIETLGPSVITLANYESLAGHAKSVEKRIRRK
ncbi:histidinol dehydrogenase [Candidatus Pelagibacter sp.]|nr:histidinol dehydrogenase [Candidatus Pelagibacter sp.]